MKSLIEMPYSQLIKWTEILIRTDENASWPDIGLKYIGLVGVPQIGSLFEIINEKKYLEFLLRYL